MKKLWIKKVFLGDDRDPSTYGFAIHETSTDDIGELYCQLRKEYGKATKLHAYDGHRKKQRGWVFSKSVGNRGTGRRFLQQVWVTVHVKPDEDGKSYYYNFPNEKRYEHKK